MVARRTLWGGHIFEMFISKIADLLFVVKKTMTTINVKEKTWLRLGKRMVRPSLTFDDIICKLLDDTDQQWLQEQINDEAIETP